MRVEHFWPLCQIHMLPEKTKMKTSFDFVEILLSPQSGVTVMPRANSLIVIGGSIHSPVRVAGEVSFPRGWDSGQDVACWILTVLCFTLMIIDGG